MGYILLPYISHPQTTSTRLNFIMNMRSIKW